MNGMKNNPCLAEESVTARAGLRMVCNSMLQSMTHAPNGKVANCQRKASAPIEMTWTSSRRNHDTMSAEKMKPKMEQMVKNINPVFTQNQKPWITR